MLERLKLSRLEAHPLTRPLHWEVLRYLLQERSRPLRLLDLEELISKDYRYAYIGGTHPEQKARIAAEEMEKIHGQPVDRETQLEAERAARLYALLYPFLEARIVSIRGFRVYPSLSSIIRGRWPLSVTWKPGNMKPSQIFEQPIKLLVDAEKVRRWIANRKRA